MDNETLAIILARIETKLDAHLADHKYKFDLFTRAVIPGTSIIVSLCTAVVTHFFSKSK